MMVNVFIAASPFQWEHIGIAYIYGFLCESGVISRLKPFRARTFPPVREQTTKKSLAMKKHEFAFVFTQASKTCGAFFFVVVRFWALVVPWLCLFNTICYFRQNLLHIYSSSMACAVRGCFCFCFMLALVEIVCGVPPARGRGCFVLFLACVRINAPPAVSASSDAHPLGAQTWFSTFCTTFSGRYSATKTRLSTSSWTGAAHRVEQSRSFYFCWWWRFPSPTGYTCWSLAEEKAFEGCARIGVGR